MAEIVSSVGPVFALIALGRILARTGFLPEGFFKASDRLVYFVLFPAMLFWKIGGSHTEFNWTFNLAVLAGVGVGYLVSKVWAKFTGMPDYQVGAFSQCCYRFNTYLGWAVILSAFGEPALVHFGIIISLAIPLINVMAVATLIWFGTASYSFREKVRLVGKAMLVNPLILACLSGIAFSSLGVPFPDFFDQTFKLLSVSALPLALLSIGHTLTLDVIKGHLFPALASCGIKLVVMPLVGFGLLRLADVEGPEFMAGLVFFALPTSTYSFILSAQLKSDPGLASACIVLSTLLSMVSLSLVMGFLSSF